MKYLSEIKKLVALLICSLICLNACKKDPEPLALNTTSITDITYSSATSGGNITSDGGLEITVRGVCWSKSQNPTINDSKTEDGSGSGLFTSTVTGLTPNTTYYLRAYATNSDGTAYGNELPFSTGLLTDFDGNTYNTVTIGDQTWMQENLRVTKLNDGTRIPCVTDEDTWLYTNEPGYGWYDNDASTYGELYGAFYNWYTVNTGKLCPVGWHVPTDAEWTTLTDFLGGEEIAGGKLKEAGTEHWGVPNTDATNESGFTALPGGYRSNGGQYYSIEWSGRWWDALPICLDPTHAIKYRQCKQV